MVSQRQGGDLADWPSPVDVLNETGRSDIVLLCEHASKHVPAAYRGLGLSAGALQGHIAWDIGAADVTRRLASALDAPAFLGTYSRLLIDLNRPLGAHDSIPVRSESTDIPGNAGIDAAERKRRTALMFEPFHHRVSACLDHRIRSRRPTWIVSIHSFTPTYLGVQRPWHVGVLYGRAAEEGEAVIAKLRADTSLNVAANVPYAISREADYAIPVHGDDRGLAAILIEIRQDLLSGPAGVEAWVKQLAGALSIQQREVVR